MITGDVVQFNEKHKWCGCLGIVTEKKEYINDIRYMVGVPMPEKGTAYIFSMESANELEYIGRAVLAEANEDVRVGLKSPLRAGLTPPISVGLK